jgi:hypothetical protein
MPDNLKEVQLKFCAKCGAENENGALFCGGCGAPLNQTGQGVSSAPQLQAQPYAPPQSQPPAGTKQRAGRGFIALIIVIPDNVTSIGDNTFNNCSKLTGVTIPEGVTGIGEYAFGNCGLVSLTIHDSVTSIGGGAFMDCEDLTSMTIPRV